MKKILIVIAVVVSILVYKKDNSIVIPYDAIRLRVIANSNTIEDQERKNKLSHDLSVYINNLLINSKSSQESLTILKNNYDNINNFISSYSNDYKVSIGKNYFPKKNYKGISYDEGYYDSIVVSLGNSNGLNWWCVVYPPLCLIDDTKEEYEYTTIIKDILDNFNL